MGDLREDRIYKILQSYWHVEENGDKAGNIHTNISMDIYIMLIILKHFLRYKKVFDFFIEIDVVLNVHFLSFLLKKMAFQNEILHAKIRHNYTSHNLLHYYTM